MLHAIDAGAEEVETEEDAFIIYTEPENFEEVKNALEAQNYTFITSEITMVPQTTTAVSEEDQEKMLKLIDMLEDNDDVQEVYHNLEM